MVIIKVYVQLVAYCSVEERIKLFDGHQPNQFHVSGRQVWHLPQIIAADMDYSRGCTGSVCKHVLPPPC